MTDIATGPFSKQFLDLLASHFSEFQARWLIQPLAGVERDNQLHLKTIFMKALQEQTTDFMPEEIQRLIDDSASSKEYETPLEIIMPHSHFSHFVRITLIDDEITITFDWYHLHFSETSMSKAIEFLKQLFAEDILIYAEVQQECKKCCGYITHSALETLEDFDFTRHDFDAIHFKSWNGTHNQVVENTF